MAYLKILFRVACAATAGLYGLMLLWSFPRITAAAGGLPPFDLRPAGYGLEEARQFLAALPPAQAEFYHALHLGLLESVYPTLFALTLYLAIGLMARRLLARAGWALALVAVPGAVLNYMENASIRLMLALGPDNLTPEIVARASTRTVMKALFTTAAMSVLLVLAVLWLWNRVTARNT